MIEERLCEKSMKMVFIFFDCEDESWTTGYRSTPTKNLKPATDSDMVIDDELPRPQFSGNQRSEKLQSSSKPRSTRNGDVNGMFAAYIRKVHEKNRSNSHEASTHSPYILPPPPTPLSRNPITLLIILLHLHNSGFQFSCSFTYICHFHAA
ncbi:hypothetical protein CXB51_007773 [Gossypium anomalum]|uniref:Uncharacterized protein n=1 Tax=Gossypium anomalum TaxID=47600 RepID=A0A8J6D6D9_9ROSI|nr:hypothetical protein CXB51_007773 [Gossypium anomalum]